MVGNLGKRPDSLQLFEIWERDRSLSSLAGIWLVIWERDRTLSSFWKFRKETGLTPALQIHGFKFCKKLNNWNMN